MREYMNEWRTQIFINSIPLFVFLIHATVFEMTLFTCLFTGLWSISPHWNISFIRVGPLSTQVSSECPLPGPVLALVRKRYLLNEQVNEWKRPCFNLSHLLSPAWVTAVAPGVLRQAHCGPLTLCLKRWTCKDNDPPSQSAFPKSALSARLCSPPWHSSLMPAH